MQPSSSMNSSAPSGSPLLEDAAAVAVPVAIDDAPFSPNSLLESSGDLSDREDETWPQWIWRELQETANPTTTHAEQLTPAERDKQASFESFDYYRAYPAMYLRYLRQKKRGERGVDAAAAAGMEPAASISLQAGGGGGGDAAGLSTSPGDGSSGFNHLSTVSRLQISLPTDDEERHTPLRWLVHVLIAFSVGVVATSVSYAVEIIENYRAESLTRVIQGPSIRLFGYVLGLFAWVLMSVALTVVATGVVVYFEPAASGGGIPDVMAYLNGVHMRKAMNIRTFVAKAVSCICAVASGLPVGLEAPLIHLGAITGAGVTQGRSRSLGFQTSFFKVFRNNKDRRDFITAGAACGVSAAFGAPIGGLLFVMEEVSSFWDHSSSGQIFLASMICFTFTTIINSLVEDNSLLGWVSNSASVLFEVNRTIPLNLISIVPSLVLGAILGGLAALFTKVNLIMIKWRRRALRPYPLRRFLEPIVVCTTYSALMYALTLLSDCRETKEIYEVNNTHYVWGTEDSTRLFNDTCGATSRYSPLGTLNMATGKNTIRHLFTRQTIGEFPAYYLFIHFIIYVAFACVSSGMALSGGLVVPSLVIGAIFGRLFGLFLWYAGGHRGLPDVERSYPITDAWMDPGVFALIGAGAFLAGTSRMAMSICVIMVELSSELHYLLPVMVAIVMSKTVADWLSEPLYHQMLHFDCVPYLSATLLLPEFEQLTAAEVMASPVVALRRKERTSVVLQVLRETSHHAFPVYEEVPIAGDGGGGAVAANTPPPPPGLRQRRPRETAVGGGAATAPPRPPHRRVFIGLVTREDLQVYFTLPQLQGDGRGRGSATPAPEGESGGEGRGHHHDDDDDDGFGGHLAPCVLEINRLTWSQWLLHKTSLFLATADRYRWVLNHVPAGSPDVGGSSGSPSTQPTEKGSSSGDGDGDGDGDSGAPPRLPPVVDLGIIVNRSPWVVPPAFNLRLVYHAFRTLGLRHLVVVDGEAVQGVITRKDLLVDALRLRMKELRLRRHGGSRQPPPSPSPALQAQPRVDARSNGSYDERPASTRLGEDGLDALFPAGRVRGPGFVRSATHAHHTVHPPTNTNANTTTTTATTAMLWE